MEDGITPCETVESVNRTIKRSQYEDIADPDKRAIRGNTFISTNVG